MIIQQLTQLKTWAMSFLNAAQTNPEEKKKFHEGTGGTDLAANGRLAGKTCLVLDDEFLIALDIQQILENAGAAKVVSVSNAAEALEALGREARFDVAVLDVKLSSGSGSSLSVAAALARRDIPFVFLTGLRADEVHAQAFPEAPVVEKPYQGPLLLAALLRLLFPEEGHPPRDGAASGSS